MADAGIGASRSKPSADAGAHIPRSPRRRRKSYLDGYAEGQADAARDVAWMQDKAWMDALLMLVHYELAASRHWLVGHDNAVLGLARAWKTARALAATKSADDIAALLSAQDHVAARDMGSRVAAPVADDASGRDQ